jgi:hypothetical protein
MTFSHSLGQEQTSRLRLKMSAFENKADQQRKRSKGLVFPMLLFLIGEQIHEWSERKFYRKLVISTMKLCAFGRSIKLP